MSQETLIKRNLLKRIIIEEIKSGINADFVMESFLENCNGYTLKYITDVISDNKQVELLYPGDFIKWKAPTSYQEKYYNEDILSEMGLLTTDKGDHWLYGVIMGDESWGSSYSPYYGRLKVAVFVHGDDSRIAVKNESLYTGDVIKVIPGSEIPRFAAHQEGYHEEIEKFRTLDL